MDLNELTCEICSLSPKQCTCPDIDERLFTLTESFGVIAKQPAGQYDERLSRTLRINKFVKTSKIEEAVAILPWEGFRAALVEKGELKDADSGLIPVEDRKN